MVSKPASLISDWKICFIGGGNMAIAMLGGLIAQGVAPRENVVVSVPRDISRRRVEEQCGVRTTTSNIEASQDADVLVVAVKPQIARGVCEELAAAWAGKDRLPLIVSIAGGTTLKSLTKWFTTPDGRVPQVVRVMPNTPALVGEAATAAFAGPSISADDKAGLSVMMEAFSKATVWVDREELIDVVVGLSGSGPAYFFAMVEHMITSAVAMGLSKEQAELLAKQTCAGAGRMLVERSESPGQLRSQVTSPNGTTAAALQSFADSGFQEIVDKAFKTCVRRAKELGKEDN